MYSATPHRDELFTEIFGSYYRQIFCFFAKRRFQPEDCRELTQETFLRVFKNIEDIRGEGSIRAYVYRAATNLFLNEIRGRSAKKRDGSFVPLDTAVENLPGDESEEEMRRLVLAEAKDREEGLIPLTAIENLSGDESGEGLRRLLSAEAAERVHAALGELPPQMRRCLELRLYQDLRYREIAAVLRIKIDTVKAHLFHARQLLQGTLGEYYHLERGSILHEGKNRKLPR